MFIYIENTGKKTRSVAKFIVDEGTSDFLRRAAQALI